MLEYIYPLLIAVVLLVALVTYLIVKIPNAYTFKWFAIPILLFGGFFSYQIYDRMLGYAYPIPMPETFMFLDYRVVRQDDGQKMVELWIVDKEGRSRLHLVPWSKKSEEQLSEAKKRAKEGKAQMGKKVPKKDGKGKDGKGDNDGDKDGKGKGNKKGRDGRSGDWDFDIELYNLPFQDVVPKDPPQR
jgi:hypothetical protein